MRNYALLFAAASTSALGCRPSAGVETQVKVPDSAPVATRTAARENDPPPLPSPTPIAPRRLATGGVYYA